MSQEWNTGGGVAPVLQREVPELSQTILPDEMEDPEEHSVKSATYADYFKQCSDNRELLQSVRVVVPVRPNDGTNNKLAQMLSVWYGEGTSWSHLNDHMGGYIEATRGNIAYTFKHDNTGAKYIIMIDNDMEPPINLPYLLARHGEAVVGSPAMSISHTHGPQLCFTVKDKNGHYRFPCLRSGEKIPSKGLKECGHVGTGAICIRRDVLDSFSFTLKCRQCGFEVSRETINEAHDDVGALVKASTCPVCKTFDHMYEDIPFSVPFKWRLKGMTTGQITLGEDISFCNQVRAKGFDLHVDLEAHCGHRKMMSLSWDEDFREPNLSAENWVGPTDGKRIVSI